MIIPPELFETIAALIDNGVFPLREDKVTAEKVLKEIQRLNPQWQRRYRPTLEQLRIKK